MKLDWKQVYIPCPISEEFAELLNKWYAAEQREIAESLYPEEEVRGMSEDFGLPRVTLEGGLWEGAKVVLMSNDRMMPDGPILGVEEDGTVVLQGLCRPWNDGLLRMVDSPLPADAKVFRIVPYGENRHAKFFQGKDLQPELLAMLETLEWCLHDDHCPYCRHYMCHGHSPDCRLALLIAKARAL
jgi:hypothetical protein